MKKREKIAVQCSEKNTHTHSLTHSVIIKWQTIEEKQREFASAQSLSHACHARHKRTNVRSRKAHANRLSVTRIGPSQLKFSKVQSKWNNQFIATIFVSDMQNRLIVSANENDDDGKPRQNL